MKTMMTALLMMATVCLPAYCQNGLPTADESLFLIPYLKADVDQVVLDVGCGTGAWALALANQGACVCAFDSHKESLDAAQVAIALAGVGERISLIEGNPLELPYQNNWFDRAVTIHMGHEMPATTRTLSAEGVVVGGLEKHMQEIARVLKPHGVATIVVPASHDVVFTSGTCPVAEVVASIQAALACSDGSCGDPDRTRDFIGRLEGVNRATFVAREGKLTLVTQMSDLQSGETIWRKEGNSVQVGSFHREEDYLIALRNAELVCTEVARPCFFGNVKYRMYQEQHSGELGLSYVEHNPFTIFIVEKR